jgi:hypothetical protein
MPRELGNGVASIVLVRRSFESGLGTLPTQSIAAVELAFKNVSNVNGKGAVRIDAWVENQKWDGVHRA